VGKLDKEQLIELLKEMFKDGTIQFVNARERGHDKIAIEIEGDWVQEFWL
jgi:hypothetical protein